MRRKNSGFSLIEVLIALLIISGTLIILSQSWSGSLFAFRKSKNLQTISTLLKKKTTELELKYTGKPLSEIPEEEGGDFGSEHPQLRWALKSKEFEFPDISAALTSKEGGANEMMLMMIKQMTEFMKKSVKELKVSIFWKSGKKELEYSITTYLVDYTQEISFAGGGGG